MIALLCCALLLSAIMHYVQYKAMRQRDADLRYICGKLNGIMEDRTSERLLLVTEASVVRDLLNGINRLLDYNHDMASDSARTKRSMRSMLTNVSHDLKTPLSVIVGYIETIQYNRSLSSGDTEALLNKVKQKALEAADLTNKFFDLAKLESGDWRMERTRVHLNEICRTSILDYYEPLTDRGFEVAIDIPEAPVYIDADANALHRILGNLLSNAVRYGRDGRTVGLALRSDGSEACIEVWDRGKGIGEKEQDRIFERLYMLEDARSVSMEGSGLGLTIAKRLTEQMDGSVEVSSRPFERTVFTLRFPQLK